MGGQGAKVEEHPTAPLCRDDHEAVHMGRFELSVSDGIACTWQGEIKASERALIVHDEAEDPRYWSDGRLAEEYWRGMTDETMGFARQCYSCYHFWKRYGWADKWYERAAEIIGGEFGKPINWRTVYKRAAVWRAFGLVWEEKADTIMLVGPELAARAAAHERPLEALDFAAASKLAGATTKATVAFLREGRTEQVEAPPMCTCPQCGALHRRKE